MTVNDIYTFLDEKYDFSSALHYDNVGLLVGALDDNVTGILVCLDCTDEAVSEAVEKGVNLIVTHHPIIFEPMKAVTDETIVYRLIKNGISVISVHTNLDQADGGVNDVLANKLGLINIEKVADSEGFFYRIGELGDGQSSDDLAESVSKKLKLPIKYIGENRYIKRIAVCSGSGGGMLGDVINQGIDAYITADVKHNVFMEGHTQGVTIIDAGHFNTEDIIVSVLAKTLREAFTELKVLENHFSPIKYTK